MANGADGLVGLHILVIEDEVMVAMMLEEMLEDFGCLVDLASSIEMAQASIRQQAFDGALLDMNLHGRTTEPIADELVSRSVPFLLVTGYAARDSDPAAIKAAPRLQKPFRQEVLARQMAQVFVPEAG